VARYAGIYRILLDPARADDPVIARQLTYLNTFGRGIYPLALRLLHEHGEASSAAELLVSLEHVQSLLLRRTVVGVTTDRLVARLCRAAAVSRRPGARDRAHHAVGRTHPRRPQVHGPPAPAYVLKRLAGDIDFPDIDWSTSPRWRRPTIGLPTASAAGPTSPTTSRTASVPWPRRSAT
jgi:hypothetical protein